MNFTLIRIIARGRACCRLPERSQGFRVLIRISPEHFCESPCIRKIQRGAQEGVEDRPTIEPKLPHVFFFISFRVSSYLDGLPSFATSPFTLAEAVTAVCIGQQIFASFEMSQY